MIREDYLAGQQPEDDDLEEGSSFLSALPGGKRATQEQYVVAAFVLGALLFLIAVRKGFVAVLAR